MRGRGACQLDEIRRCTFDLEANLARRDHHGRDIVHALVKHGRERLLHADRRAAAAYIAGKAQQFLDMHHLDRLFACRLGCFFQVKLLNGKGNIAILTGPSGDAGGLQRMEGYENILKNYPEIKQVVAPADCQWDTASAQSTVESWLSAYDLDAIVCENDGMAVGAGNAAGANSGIIITGVDGTPDGFEAIQDGRITGTVSQNGGAMAANGIEAAVKLLKGETLDTTEIVTDNSWFVSSNVKDYELFLENTLQILANSVIMNKKKGKRLRFPFFLSTSKICFPKITFKGEYVC